MASSLQEAFSLLPLVSSQRCDWTMGLKHAYVTAFILEEREEKVVIVCQCPGTAALPAPLRVARMRGEVG